MGKTLGSSQLGTFNFGAFIKYQNLKRRLEMASKKTEFDFMAIGAHPDDVELFCGGTILKLIQEGKQGVIVDVTDGKAGTRGDANIRQREAQKASKVLGITERVNLGLEDTAVKNNRSSQLALVEVIRKYRPRVIITHWKEDEHPDHRATCHLVQDSSYLGGLEKLECAGRPFRPKRIFYFPGNGQGTPSFCVDISKQWKLKIKAIQCYSSQFFGKKVEEFKGKSDLATPEFLQSIELRFRHYGSRIRRGYAEPFLCDEIPEVNDITELGEKRF